MNLAGKCQGFFHCKSLSAWSYHDTYVAVIIIVILFIIAAVVQSRR